MPSNGRAIAAFSSALVGNNYVNLRVIARERAGEEHKIPHPEEAAHRSRACPTSATLKCRNRQQPISMRGRPEAPEGRRIAAGTIWRVAVLRDARNRNRLLPISILP